GLGGAALGWAVWLAVKGAAVDAPPGSLQSIKYLLPATLGVAALVLRSVNRHAERAQLPGPLAQRLDRQACFLFFCGTGIWLMAAVLHDYLSAGLSNPRLAPWVNNAYWLLASGLIATGLLAEIRRRWLLRVLSSALQRRQE